MGKVCLERARKKAQFTKLSTYMAHRGYRAVIYIYTKGYTGWLYIGVDVVGVSDWVTDSEDCQRKEMGSIEAPEES